MARRGKDTGGAARTREQRIRVMPPGTRSPWQCLLRHIRSARHVMVADGNAE